MCIRDSVVVVGRNRPSVGQVNLRAIDTGEVRTTRAGLSGMASDAAILGEQFFALLRKSSAGAAGQPRLVLRRLPHHDFADHAGVLRAAVLGAKDVVRAGLGG